MQDLISFYKTQLQNYSEALSEVKKQLTASSILRLLIFVLMVIGVYVFFGNLKIALAIFVVGISIFLYFSE